MRKIIEKVVAGRPVDAVAARVMSGGESYDPEINFASHVHSGTPLPTAPAPPSGGPSPIGTKFGRFVVVGYAAVQNKKKNAKWVVRCACGAYEHRNARAFRNDNDCCRRCRHAVISAQRYERTISKRERHTRMLASVCDECGVTFKVGHSDSCSLAWCRQNVIRDGRESTQWCREPRDSPLHPDGAHEYRAPAIKPTTPHAFRPRTLS